MPKLDHKLPNSNQEAIALIEHLGFVRKTRIGKGSHQYKYIHPSRKMICQDERPFIIIPYKFFKVLAKKLYRKLICFEFSRLEIKMACEKI